MAPAALDSPAGHPQMRLIRPRPTARTRAARRRELQSARYHHGHWIDHTVCGFRFSFLPSRHADRGGGFRFYPFEAEAKCTRDQLRRLPADGFSTEYSRDGRRRNPAPHRQLLTSATGLIQGRSKERPIGANQSAANNATPPFPLAFGTVHIHTVRHVLHTCISV